MKLVVSMAPPEEALALARKLVEEGLAACVNAIPGARSIYRWKGEICDEGESLMLIKTTREAAPALMARLEELHSYEVPEVIAIDVGEGSEAYLAWLEENVRRDAGRS